MKRIDLKGMPQEEFDAAVEAKVQELKREGFDQAAICGRSIEIEEAIVTGYLEHRNG